MGKTLGVRRGVWNEWNGLLRYVDPRLTTMLCRRMRVARSGRSGLDFISSDGGSSHWPRLDRVRLKGVRPRGREGCVSSGLLVWQTPRKKGVKDKDPESRDMASANGDGSVAHAGNRVTQRRERAVQWCSQHMVLPFNELIFRFLCSPGFVRHQKSPTAHTLSSRSARWDKGGCSGQSFGLLDVGHATPIHHPR